MFMTGKREFVWYGCTAFVLLLISSALEKWGGWPAMADVALVAAYALSGAILMAVLYELEYRKRRKRAEAEAAETPRVDG